VHNDRHFGSTIPVSYQELDDETSLDIKKYFKSYRSRIGETVEAYSDECLYR